MMRGIRGKNRGCGEGQPGVRRGLVAVLLAVVFLMTSGALKAESFFQHLPDLPLMAGLTEVSEAGLLFDKPEGRIAEAFAQGDAGAGPEPAEVLRFYRQSLPQLGWQEGTSPTLFVRENEQLSLEIQQDQGRLLLHISLSPR